MTERPIIFSAPMVRALIEGRKTQTRRVVKLPHQNPLGQWEPIQFGGPNGGRTASGETIPEQGGIWHTRTGDCLGSPHGQPGDRLWVRESLKFVDTETTKHDHTIYAADGVRVPRAPQLVDWACDGAAYGFAKSVPSIHMPRWASRISLEITGVRVERLNEISGQDAIAEGLLQVGEYDSFSRGKSPLWWFEKTSDDTCAMQDSVTAFLELWNSINAARGFGWDTNPWVWVVEFKRV